MKTKLMIIVGGIVALIGMVPGTLQAQSISWTNSLGGSWTNAGSWSPNAAPSNNPTVSIVNAGSKTVTIDAATPAGNLTVTNLTITSAANATNTLVLSGNATPLNILGTLTLDGGGSAIVVDGGQLATSALRSYLNGGSVTVSNGGWLASGELAVGWGAPGTLTLAGGSNVFSTLTLAQSVTGTGTVVMTGGHLTTSAANLGNASGGVGIMTVSGGTWGGGGNTAVGLAGGSLGTLNLAGGTNLLSGLLIGHSGGATGTVSMTGGQLVTTNSGGTEIAYVGNNGVGTMTVSGGQWLANEINVGSAPGSKGTLNIAGGTNVLSNILVVGGGSAAGTLLMTDGQLVTTNSAGNNVAYVGIGVGDMTVSGGTWLANQVVVGRWVGSKGTLTLAGGTNVFSSSFTVGSINGDAATGTVLMTGGRLVVTNGTTYLGNGMGALGAMTVSNGTWLANAVQVGAVAGSKGTLNISSGSSVLTSLSVGSQAGATGSVTLVNNGTIDVAAGLRVGDAGVGNLLLNGGVLTSTLGATYIAPGSSSIGSVIVSNGVLNLNHTRIASDAANSSGSLTVVGGTNNIYGYLAVGAGGFAGVNGSVLVSDSGVMQIASANLIYVGAGASVGTITNRNGGLITFVANPSTLTVASGSSFVVTNATIGFQGLASADVLGVSTNMTLQAGSRLRLDSSTDKTGISAYTIGGAGNYSQLELIGANSKWQSALLNVGADGTLLVSNATAATVSAVVTNAGTVRVVNSGLIWSSNVVLNSGSYLSQAGTNTFNSGLTVASGVSFSADAASTVSVLGNYQNLGSSVFSNRYTVASGSRYRSWGGSTNQFVGGLTIASGGGLDVTNGQSVMGGTITNLGSMTVFNAQAIYNGNVVNQGAYVSDPSTNTFNGNFTVGPTATVVAASGDIYAFGSNFVMQSTNRTFDMSLARVVFADTGYGITTGTTNHTFNLASSGAIDKGSNWLDHTQLATNFSIGTLTIASGNRLTLTGSAGTNALYVGVLDLSAWNTNAGTSLTNTLQAALSLDINLYYDKYAPNNAYLQGVEFGLWGGGLLIPIPEPSAMLALSAGLAFLMALRCRRV